METASICDMAEPKKPNCENQTPKQEFEFFLVSSETPLESFEMLANRLETIEQALNVIQTTDRAICGWENHLSNFP